MADGVKDAVALGANVAATTALGQPPSLLTEAEKAKLKQKPVPQGVTVTQEVYTQSLIDAAEKIKAEQIKSQLSKTISKDPKEDSPNVVTNNVLRDYVNYTYRLSFHIVTPAQFNSLVKSPAAYKPEHVLIASAGAFSNSRPPEFKEDFYFDNLSVSTIIGLNARSRESNAIDLSFNIIEPYGCSLLDKLISVTQRLITGSSENKGNYLTMPYMIQIDFFGYDTTGTPKIIPSQTKYLPVKLIEMKIKPDASGTRYQVRAIPYHHQLYRQYNCAIPANYEITAADIEHLFKATGSGQDQVSESYKSAQQAGNIERAKVQQQASRDLAESGFDPNSDAGKRAIKAAGDSAYAAAQADLKDKSYNAASLGDALNNWNKLLLDQKLLEYPDEYAFVFDDDIGKSPLILDKKQTEKKQAPSGTNKDIKEGKAPAQGAKSAISNSSIYPVNDKQNMFRVNAGSTIINLLDVCVRNSEFIRKQIKDANDLAAAAKNQSASRDASTTSQSADEPPLTWFKITAEVSKLGDFDRIRNEFAKTMTFYVKTYEVTNVKYPFVSQKKATRWSKEYNYFYTGKNTDVIGVDINFDTMFYTTISTNPDRFKDTNAQLDSAPTQEDSKKSRMYSQTGVPFPDQKRPTNNLADLATTGYAQRDAKTAAISDLANSLMNNSRGDALQLKLEIIGDPDFIKQDDLFFTRTKGQEKVNNSIATDDGQINVKLNFKLPHDWTSEKGLLSPSNDTVFDGLYRVLRVDSTFERGEFKQSLEMIRLHDDAADNKRRGQTNTDYDNSINNAETAKFLRQQGEAKKSSSGVAVVAPTGTSDPKPDPTITNT